MSEVVATYPGKAGDALMQFPIMYWWAQESGKQFTAWLDRTTCAPLVNLFAAQPCVEKVELVDGVESYSCGGQPFHLNLPTSAFKDRTIYHMGLRKFPSRQLTLECRDSCNVPLNVSQADLSETPCIEGAGWADKINRLLIHGQGVYAHTRSTPTVWKFLAGIKSELESIFDEIVFVGSPDDRKVGLATYPDWKDFDDQGDFLNLAQYMNASRCVIGCGSSNVALAGALKVPSIRVHDPVGGQGNEAPRVIFSNLGKNQLNATEIDLRDEWPTWRDAHLAG